MAFTQIGRLLLRQWLVVLAGILATSAGAYWVREQPPLYSAQAGVLVAPAVESSAGINPLLGREYGLIVTAGLITEMVNNELGVPRAQTSSSSTTLAGQGVTDGVQIRLYNGGNQWVPDFARPIIDVQSVARSAGRADDNLDMAVAALTAALEELQDDRGVPPTRRLAVTLVPEEPAYAYSQGRPMRAFVAMLLLGGSLTLAAAAVLDRLRGGRPVGDRRADPVRPPASPTHERIPRSAVAPEPVAAG